MRAAIAWLALAALAPACSAIVSSENNAPACEVTPGAPDPCPTGSLCVGDVMAGSTLRGTCRSGCVPEVCDGLDNDCDTKVDEDPTFDADGDTYTWCGSGSRARIDCNDGNPAVHPYDAVTMMPVDVCDGIDNDCDGVVDENACPMGQFCSTAHRCYFPGDCTVPEGAGCGPMLFCDLAMMPTARCTIVPTTGCLAMPGSCPAGQRCDPAMNRCQPLAPLGALCGTDGDCASGACFEAAALSYTGSASGRVCSAPCCATADCGGGVCRVTALGGRGCVPATTDAPGACGDNRDCAQGICHASAAVTTGGSPHLRTVCAPGTPQTLDHCSTSLCVFGFCAQCNSGTCLSNGCAISCTGGAECASGICVSGLCRDPCRTSAECPTEQRCGLLSHNSDRIQGCVFRQRGLSSAGSHCGTATDCVDNYCNGAGRCSAVCCTDADCGSDVCRPVNNGGWEMRCVPRG